MLESPLAIATALVAVVAVALWLESTFRWARVPGAALLTILFGITLSNLGWLPAESPVYELVSGPLTSLAVVWLLVSLRLEALRAAGARMLYAFLLALTATCVGAVLSTLLFADSLGADSWKLGGVMTGTYSGGALNFVSVARGLNLEKSIFAAAAAADNIVTSVWIGATLILPLWLRKRFPSRPRDSSHSRKHQEAPPLRALDLTLLLLLGLGLLLVARLLHQAVPAIPTILWLTTLALVAAQLPSVRRLEGGFLIGSLALYFFFAVTGIGSRIDEIARYGWVLLVYTALVVAVHGVLIYGAGRLLRLDVETLSVASQAAIGGPPTAMALAAHRGWRDLVVPGLAVGLLGYAVGSYLGFAVAYALRSLLG